MFNVLCKAGDGEWWDFLGYETTEDDAKNVIQVAKQFDYTQKITNRSYKIVKKVEEKDDDQLTFDNLPW